MRTSWLIPTILITARTAFPAWAWTFQTPSRNSISRGEAFVMSSSLDDQNDSSFPRGRRQVLKNLVLVGGAVLSSSQRPDAVWAAERAIGGAEASCREAGNCLETWEWDGAIGWTWGGKDRCDATDPRCGVNGQLQEALPSGKPVPVSSLKITHIVSMAIIIGKNERGLLRFGLFGDDFPRAVSQLVGLCSSQGLMTMSEKQRQNTIGGAAVPLELAQGGILSELQPGQRLVFGIPSQSAAYARARGRSKAGDGFKPQPRPAPLLNEESTPLRSHDAAGLVSIPSKGIGYALSATGPDDEAFEQAFEITADAVPSMDKTRRVIGKVLDESSMTFLARLASLPTRKGIKGVLPGQNAGPPLLRVVVANVAVEPLKVPL